MTEDVAAVPVRNLPADRLATLGHRSPTRKPEGGPPELTARHRLLISYMVDGCPHQSACDRVWIERPVVTQDGSAIVTRHPRPHEPLSLIEAADACRIKRRNARQLAGFPIFKAELERQLRLFRDGERAANLHRMVAVRDDPGVGKAADRKVQLQAAALLNGDIGGAPTVNVNVGAQITAGIVIERYRPDDDERETKTIEHEVRR